MAHIYEREFPNLHINVEIQKKWYSIEQCNQNPNKLYVFGDNLKRVGKGGQAMIRDAYNAFGIATKRTPSMDEAAFFSDRPDEAIALFEDIYNLVYTFYNNETFDTIVLPADGLGTGLSEMPHRSPRLFEWMNNTLSTVLNIEYNP